MPHRGTLLANLHKAKSAFTSLVRSPDRTSLAEVVLEGTGFRPTPTAIHKVLRAVQNGRPLHEVLSGACLGPMEPLPRRPLSSAFCVGVTWSFAAPQTEMTMEPLSRGAIKALEVDLGLTPANTPPTMPLSRVTLQFGNLARYHRVQVAFDDYVTWVQESGAFVVPVDPTSPEGSAMFDGIVRHEKNLFRLAGVRPDPSSLAFLRFLVLRGYFSSADFLLGLWEGSDEGFA